MIEIDALIFDLDGTLIDSAADLADCVRTLQHRNGRSPSTDAQVASFVGDGVISLVQRAVPGLRDDALQQEVAFFKQYYRLHCLDKTRLYPGVQDVLQHYRHKKLAVVTNKPIRATRHILEGLGILSCFHVVLGGDSLSRKKPDPEPIRHALQQMAITQPRRAVMVGDSTNDILAGQQAGCYSCRVASSFGDVEQRPPVQPDFTLINTLELMRIFN